MTTSTHT